MGYNQLIHSESKAVSFTATYRDAVRKFFLLMLLCVAISFFVLDMLHVSFVQSVQSKATQFFSSAISLAKAPRQTILNLQSSWQQHLQGVQENRHLKQKIRRYQAMERSVYALEQENRRLKHALHYQTPEQTRYKTARFLSMDHIPYRHIAMLDQGRAQSLAAGDIVLYGKQVLGRITTAYANQAEVMLVQDIRSHVPVVSNKSNVQAVLVGQGSETAILKLVHGDTLPEVGEVVLTSGSGNVFPYGLFLGRVIAVSRQEILVDVSRHWSEIDYVAIEAANATPNTGP